MPRSMATPMAGTCEQAMPAMILATVLALTLCLSLVAVAGRAAPAIEHHLRVSLLGHARHHAGHILERQTVAEGDLDGVVNIAPEPQHAEPIAIEHGSTLIRAQGEAI